MQRLLHVFLLSIALNIVLVQYVVEAKQGNSQLNEDQETLLASPGRQLQVMDSDTESDTSIVLYETNL